MISAAGPMNEGEVWVLDDQGGRLLYAAGTAEAEAWHADNSEPHDLDPVTDTAINDVPQGEEDIEEEDVPLVKSDPVPEETE